MKRQIVLALSVLMVFALAIPAAAQVNFGGRFEFNSEYSKVGSDPGEFDVTRTRLRLTPDVRPANGVRVRGEYRIQVPASGSGATTHNVNWENLWVDISGPLLHGGDSYTLSAGRFGNNWNEWVARFTERNNAVRLSGVGIGPLNLTGYFGHDGAATDVKALRGQVSVDMVSLDGTYVIIDSGSATSDWSISGTVAPASGVSLNAIYAGHGASETSAYRAGVKLDTVPNFTIGAEYYSAEVGFAPTYGRAMALDSPAERGLKNRRDTWGRRAPADSKGFIIDVATTQAGIPLGLVYRNQTDQAGNNAATVIEVTGEVQENWFKFHTVNQTAGNLTTYSVGRHMDLPLLSRTNLWWETIDPVTGDMQHSINVDWVSPMGIDAKFSYGLSDSSISLNTEYTIIF